MSLFLAWMPEGSARGQLAGLRDDCRRADVHGWTSWRGDAQLHMTLRFLARLPPEHPSGLRESMTAIARQFAPFVVTFDRLQPWASALVVRTAENDPLRALLSALNHAAIDAGYAEMDEQTPHLTLAYPPRDAHGRKRRLAQVPACDPSLLPITAPFDEIAIVQTGANGYERLARWPLAGAQ